MRKFLPAALMVPALLASPAAFAFDPEDIGRTAPVPAAPLVYYPPEYPLAPYDPREWGLTGTFRF